MQKGQTLIRQIDGEGLHSILLVNTSIHHQSSYNEQSQRSIIEILSKSTFHNVSFIEKITIGIILVNCDKYWVQGCNKTAAMREMKISKELTKK